MITGWTSGTFDMFHIGHLNLLKNAKKHCDKLIVGVNSDELVYSYKKKTPIIPTNERYEILKSCRYIDEVVIREQRDCIDLYNAYRFDIMFIGDDYIDSQKYKELDKELRKFGSKVMFLPYTKSISSSILREKINLL
jgi:glycerol-3-phosphate cytidylyltransferase